jgi:hypothetical protein
VHSPMLRRAIERFKLTTTRDIYGIAMSKPMETLMDC